MPYKWTHRKPLTRLSGEDVQPGEEFEPTDAERQSFADAMEEVPDDESEGDAEDTDDGEDAAESSAEDTPLSEKHWRTAVTEVEEGQHDDRLAELAESGDLSDSVQEAVEERQAELAE